MFIIEMVFAIIAMLTFIFGLYKIICEYYEPLPSRLRLCYGAIDILFSALIVKSLPLAATLVLLWVVASALIAGAVLIYCQMMESSPYAKSDV